MNVYDQQLVADGRILRALGVMLRRESRPTVVVCAWCEAKAGRKPDVSLNQSHGICPAHYAEMVSDLELARQERERA